MKNTILYALILLLTSGCSSKPQATKVYPGNLTHECPKLTPCECKTSDDAKYYIVYLAGEYKDCADTHAGLSRAVLMH